MRFQRSRKPITPFAVDTALLSLFSLYTFILFAGGLAAVVFQFIADAREGNTNPLEPWRLRWSDAFLLGWGFITAMLALSLALAKIGDLQISDNQQLIINVVGWQGGMLLLLLGLLFLFPRQFNLVLSPQKPGLRRVLWQAIAQWLAAFFLIMLISLCWQGVLLYLKKLGLGDYTEKQELVTLLSQSLSLPLGVLLALLAVAVIIAPLAEELLFRGLLYRFLKSRMSARWAMVASSVCFGAIHFNVSSFIPLTFFGMVLVRAYERTGSLKVPILMHALFNASTTFFALASSHIQEMADRISAT